MFCDNFLTESLQELKIHYQHYYPLVNDVSYNMKYVRYICTFDNEAPLWVDTSDHLNI